MFTDVKVMWFQLTSRLDFPFYESDWMKPKKAEGRLLVKLISWRVCKSVKVKE